MALRRVYVLRDGAIAEPHMVGLKVANAFEDQFKALGVTSAHLAVLAKVHELGEAASGSISAHLLTDRPTVQKALRYLESLGAIETVGQVGRRENSAVVTATGRILLDHGFRIWNSQSPANLVFKASQDQSDSDKLRSDQGRRATSTSILSL